MFSIPSFVSPSNLYNYLSFIFSKQNILSVFSLVPFDVTSGATMILVILFGTTHRFSGLLLKCVTYVLSPDAFLVNLDYIQWTVGTLFLGSTH